MQKSKHAAGELLGSSSTSSYQCNSTSPVASILDLDHRLGPSFMFQWVTLSLSHFIQRMLQGKFTDLRTAVRYEQNPTFVRSGKSSHRPAVPSSFRTEGGGGAEKETHRMGRGSTDIDCEIQYEKAENSGGRRTTRSEPH